MSKDGVIYGKWTVTGTISYLIRILSKLKFNFLKYSYFLPFLVNGYCIL